MSTAPVVAALLAILVALLRADLPRTYESTRIFLLWPIIALVALAVLLP